MTKKLTTIILVLLLTLSALPLVFATGTPTITVSSATAAPGETVNLKVSLSNNPGINTFALGFDYDTSRLSLTNVTANADLGGQFTYSKKAVWLNSVDSTYTGEILTLTFKVLDNAAAGNANVAVTYNAGDISNYNEDDVDFNLVDGKVTVIESQNPPAGDFDAKAILDNVTGRPGDTVCIGVSLDRELDVKSMAISDLSYDKAKLSLTGGEWNVNGAILSDWRQNDEVGAVAFRENTKLQGTVFCLSFKILDNLDDCEISVGCEFQVKTLSGTGMEEQFSIQNVPGSVKVINTLRGDVNGDDFVNSNDAIHLLYHTLLPDRYMINQSGDFDGDGYVNSNDAIYLLYFTLLPERYPLH